MYFLALPSASGVYYSSLPQGRTLVSARSASRALQHDDGRLCVYDSASNATVWCSLGTPMSRGDYYTRMQGDGNLCTFTGTPPATSSAEDAVGSKQIWCAGSAPKPIANSHPQFYAAVQDSPNGGLCVYSGSAPSVGEDERVWCSNGARL